VVRLSGAGQWSKAFGPHGRTINLYEELGGILYISFCDPATGKEVRRSLGHGNISVVQQVYQQADRETLLRVLTEPMELRDVAVKEPQLESPEGAGLRVVR